MAENILIELNILVKVTGIDDSDYSRNDIILFISATWIKQGNVLINRILEYFGEGIDKIKIIPRIT